MLFQSPAKKRRQGIGNKFEQKRKENPGRSTSFFSALETKMYSHVHKSKQSADSDSKEVLPEEEQCSSVDEAAPDSGVVILISSELGDSFQEYTIYPNRLKPQRQENDVEAVHKRHENPGPSRSESKSEFFCSSKIRPMKVTFETCFFILRILFSLNVGFEKIGLPEIVSRRIIFHASGTKMREFPPVGQQLAKLPKIYRPQQIRK